LSFPCWNNMLSKMNLARSEMLYSFCGSDFAWNYPFREDAFHMFLIFRGNKNRLPSM